MGLLRDILPILTSSRRRNNGTQRLVIHHLVGLAALLWLVIGAALLLQCIGHQDQGMEHRRLVQAPCLIRICGLLHTCRRRTTAMALLECRHIMRLLDMGHRRIMFGIE